jgi:hypothetical protein
MRYSTIIILTLLLILGSCKTKQDCVCPNLFEPVCGANGKTFDNGCLANCEDIPYISGECPVYGIGIVQYEGDTSQNGCGYFINILNEKYKPLNLTPQFQQDELLISLKYRKLNEYYICDNPYGNHRKIEILEIDEINP